MVLTVWFSAQENERGASWDALFAETTRYTLLHQPGGSDRGAYAVFTDRSWHRVFASRGGPTSRSGRDRQVSDGDLEGDHRMAALAATRFFAGDALQPEPYGPRSVVDRRRVWALGTSPEGYDAAEVWADEARPAPAEGGAAPRSTAPAPLPPSFEGASSWLTLYAQADTREVGPVAGAVRPADAEEHARVAENESVVPALLGVWEVDAEGQYRHAAFADGGGGDGDEPDVIGAPAPYVLVPTDFVSDTRASVYAHTFYAKPAWARVRLTLDRGVSPGQDALTPLDFAVGPDGEHFEADARNGRWDGAAGMWACFVPDPVRVPTTLAADMRRALDRLVAWSSASAEAAKNAGLVATACFDPEHRRGHLVPALGDPDGLGIRSAWESEGVGVPAPPTVTALDHFRYGLACQQASLAHEVRRAAGRLDLWERTGAVRGLTLDITAAGRPGAASAALAEDGAAVLFDALEATCAGGARSRAVLEALEEAGVFRAIEDARGLDDLGAALGPVADAEETSWSDALMDPTLKMWWKVGRKNTRLATKALRAVLPPLVAGTVLARRSVLRTRLGPDAAVVTAHFVNAMETGEGPGTLVYSERAYADDGGITERRRMRSRDAVVRVGPLETVMVDVRGTQTLTQVAEDFPRWVHWEVGYTQQMTPRNVVRSGLNVVDGVMSVANAALAGVALGSHLSEGGEVRFRDAMAVVKGASDLADAWDKLRRPVGKIGGALVTVGPYAEMFLGTVEAWDAVRNVRQRGLQDIPDVDEGALASALLVVAGSALMVFAAPIAGAIVGAGTASVAAVTTWVTVSGVVFQVLGAYGIWDADKDAAAVRLADDPLGAWLRDTSVWGAAARLDPADLALALPGWAGGEAETDFEAQTEGFVEAAFVFPARVDVSAGLAFEVTPVYLPPEGTLLLSASVADPAFPEDGVPVRAVVRFAKAGAAFRYAVSTAPSPGTPPAPAPPSTGPGALGAGWPRRAAPADALAVPAPGWMAGWAVSVPSEGGAALRVRAVDGALGLGALGAASVVAPGAAALAAAPGGAVSGAVYFRPLAPTDTSVPKTTGDREPVEPAVARALFDHPPGSGGSTRPAR